MTFMMSETPWKNGFYYNDRETPRLHKVEGEKLLIFPIVYLDYPDLEPICDGSWTYGDFGPARNEIQEASGVQNYNWKVHALGGIVSK